MNSRGMNLLATDIIKSDVIGKINEDNRDDYTDKWEEIETQLGRDDFNDLFGHKQITWSMDEDGAFSATIK